MRSPYLSSTSAGSGSIKQAGGGQLQSIGQQVTDLAASPIKQMINTPVTPSLNLETVQQAKAAIRQQLDRKQMLGSAGVGLAAGAGLAGVGLLFKTIAKSMQRSPSSYTAPIESVVYRPDRPKRRRRKVALGPAMQSLAGDDMGQWVKLAVPAAVGLPLGFLGAKKLTDVVRGIARHNELRAAQQEFELAMQQYAESADQPRKLEKLVAKRASGSERDMLLLCLAENCCYLAKTAAGGLIQTTGKAALAYAVLAPLLAGVYGFNNRWDQRAAKDLDTAERQLNIQREAVNPTFMVASLQDPPDHNGTTDGTDDDEADQELRDAVAGGYNTDYL